MRLHGRLPARVLTATRSTMDCHTVTAISTILNARDYFGFINISTLPVDGIILRLSLWTKQ
jgi:hypothetical protein